MINAKNNGTRRLLISVSGSETNAENFMVDILTAIFFALPSSAACPFDKRLNAPSFAGSPSCSSVRQAIVFKADLNVNPGAPCRLARGEDMFASHDTWLPPAATLDL